MGTLLATFDEDWGFYLAVGLAVFWGWIGLIGLLGWWVSGSRAGGGLAAVIALVVQSVAIRAYPVGNSGLFLSFPLAGLAGSGVAVGLRLWRQVNRSERMLD